MMVLRLLRRLLPAALGLAVAALVLLAGSYAVGILWIERREPGTPVPPPGRVLSVDGRRVHVVERGRGRAVVLLHGLAGSAAEWPRRLVDALAAEHRVLAIDLLGMGFSARDDALAYGPDLWAQQVAGVMDALSIERADLIGRDLGAAVAAAFAARHPARTRRLVLIAMRVPLGGDDEPPRLWWLRVPGAGELLMGRSADELRALRGARDAATEGTWAIPGTRRAMLQIVRAGLDPGAFGAALRAIRAPVLVIHGRADALVPFAAVSRWVPLIDGVMVRPLDTIGHWPTDEAGDTVTALVTEFLGGEP